MFSPNPLGQKKATQHGLPEIVKTIGNISQISKGPYLGGGDAAECTSWAHMVLHGDPCKNQWENDVPRGRSVCGPVDDGDPSGCEHGLLETLIKP